MSRPPHASGGDSGTALTQLEWERALEAALGPWDSFVGDHWGRNLCHRPSALPRQAGQIFVETLDGFAHRDIAVPPLRLVKEQKDVEAREYSREAGDGARLASMPEVWEEFTAGATLVLNRLQRHSASTLAACAALEDVFTREVTATLFITPAGAQGLVPHHDAQDVVVLQLDGEKQWQLYGIREPDPLGCVPAPEVMGTDPVREIVLGPGDLLYVPRGMIHMATSLTGAPSSHVTFVVETRTWGDILTEAVRTMRQVPALRAHVPVGYALDLDSQQMRVARGAAVAALEASLPVENAVQAFAIDDYWSRRDSEPRWHPWVAAPSRVRPSAHARLRSVGSDCRRWAVNGDLVELERQEAQVLDLLLAGDRQSWSVQAVAGRLVIPGDVVAAAFATLQRRGFVECADEGGEHGDESRPQGCN